MDGTVNLWKMSNPESRNLFIIEKIFMYSLYSPELNSKLGINPADEKEAMISGF
jgi:hypothetical protein